jgi:hypothetical protein
VNRDAALELAETNKTTSLTRRHDHDPVRGLALLPARPVLDPAEEHTAPGYADFFGSAAAAGVLRGGEALYPAREATTITVAEGKGGPISTTPGPAIQAPQILGGFYLIDAADLDEATNWAVQIPAAWRGRIELRPVVPMQNKPG